MKNTGFINEITKRLKAEYGNRKWKLRPDAIGVLIQTILSQNTSDINSDKAFSNLIGYYKNWDAVNSAPLNDISGLIKHGGLSVVKAGYIKKALHEIKLRHGKLDLEFLRDMRMEDARKWLTDLPGVGLKTANCVLLFSLGMPALPVDTHIFRVSKRLGLIDSNTSVEQAHAILEKMVPPSEAYPFHILMIEHGRKTCGARNPSCSRCGLSDICPSSTAR